MDGTEQSPSKLKQMATLKKLKLGQPEPAFDPRSLQALADNCLGVTDPAARTSLFDAVSEALFLTREHASVLRVLCQEYLRTCASKRVPEFEQSFTPNIKKLDFDSPQDYIRHQELYIFDPISLELLSSLFELSIRVYSVSPQNRIPFCSSINCMYTRKIELLSCPTDDALLYAALFEEPYPQYARLLRAEGGDLHSVQLIERAITGAHNAADKELYTLMKAEAEFNLLVLQRLKEKFKLVAPADSDGRVWAEAAPRIGPQLQENEKTEVIESIVSTYEGCICKYLNLASLMDFHMKKLTKTEVELNSAQKMLAQVYHQYAKSVKVDQVIEKNKIAADQTGSSQSEADRLIQDQFSTKQTEGSPQTNDRIDQVLIDLSQNSFPNRVDPHLRYDHFLDQKPPGLSRPVMYINNTKVKKILNESVLQSKHVPVLSEDKTVEASQNYLMDKIQEIKSNLNSERKKPVVILEDKKGSFKGRLKFFKEEESYGFITDEDSKEDIFVHQDELLKAGLTSKDFKVTANGKKQLVSFSIVSYIGKNGKSKKAVDLKAIPDYEEPVKPLEDVIVIRKHLAST